MELSERERLQVERMRTARWRNELTQRAAAAALSVTPTYLSHLEAGRRHPSLSLLSRMAKRYGVGMAWLLGETPNAPPFP